MASHAPAPWTRLPHPDGTVSILAADGSPVAVVNDGNSFVIAAAPCLLDALQTVWDAYGFDPSIDSSIWQTVQAALTRAEPTNN